MKKSRYSFLAEKDLIERIKSEMGSHGFTTVSAFIRYAVIKTLNSFAEKS